MKKATALLTLGAAAGALGTYKFFDWAFKVLIHRDFAVSESLGSFFTQEEKKNESEEAKRMSDDMQWLLDYGFERHSITNVDGNRLQGYLMKPERESKVYVFGAHGYRSDGKGEWCHYAKHYVEDLGYNMFFVDHQAAGESEGTYIGFSSYESRDCLQWLDYMREAFGEDIEIILHGISMGSATVMLMTGSESLAENVKFTIADCGFTSAMDEFTYKLESLHIPAFPLLHGILAVHKKRVGYDFQKDTDALSAVARAKIPMLFVHGDKDNFVPTFMAGKLYEACSSEYKRLLIVEGADHAMSYRYGKEAYEAEIRSLTEKFITK